MAFTSNSVSGEVVSISKKLSVSVTVGAPQISAPLTLEEWTESYFGGGYNVTSNSDFDGDGHFDYLEYYAGTDPTDGASRLQIADTTLEGEDAVITWSPTSEADGFDRTYRIFRSVPDALGILADPDATLDELTTFAEENASITNLGDISSKGNATSYTDKNVRNQFPLFYRVFLSQPIPEAP